MPHKARKNMDPTTTVTSSTLATLTHRERVKMTSEEVLRSSWNETHEKVIEKWDRHALYYEIMHDRTCQYYREKHRYLGGAATVFAALTTTFEFATLANPNEDVSLAASLTAMFATGLVALLTFLHFEEESVHHKQKANRYYAIRQDLQEMMTYNREDRTPVRIFMYQIKRQFSALASDSISIPESIVKQYISDVDKVLAQEGISIQIDSVVQSKRSSQSQSQDPKDSKDTQNTPRTPRTLVGRETPVGRDRDQEQKTPEKSPISSSPTTSPGTDRRMSDIAQQLAVRRTRAEIYQLERLNSNPDGFIDCSSYITEKK